MKVLQSSLTSHLLVVLLVILPVILSGIDTGLSVLELLMDLNHRDLLLNPDGRREEPGGPAVNILVRFLAREYSGEHTFRVHPLQAGGSLTTGLTDS